MAFGNITADTEAFGPQGEGGLLSGMLIGAQMRQIQDQQAQQRRTQQQEEATAGALQGIDPNNPESFKPLYGVNPLLAMKLETEAAARRKAMADEAEAQKKQNQDKYMQWSKSVANAWAQLPPGQRSPDRANAMLDASIKQYRMMDPQFAGLLAQFPQENQQWFEHALVNGGFQDPYEQDQREINKYRQERSIDNQMPMTAEQRDSSQRGWAQMDMEQQRMQQTAQNSQYERGQKYWEAVQSEQRRFDALPGVQTYKVAASEMSALTKLAEQDNKAANIGIILGAAKIGDPIGSVREGDQILWNGTGPWYEKLRGMYSTLIGGGKFTPQMKADILKEARTKVEALKGGFDKEVSSIEETAQQRGFQRGHLKTGAQDIAPSKLEQVWEALRANPDKAQQIREYAKSHGIPDTLLW